MNCALKKSLKWQIFIIYNIPKTTELHTSNGFYVIGVVTQTFRKESNRLGLAMIIGIIYIKQSKI